MTNHVHRCPIIQFNTKVLPIRSLTYLSLNITWFVWCGGNIILQQAHYGICIRLALFMHNYDDWMEMLIVLARASYDSIYAGWATKRWKYVTSRRRQWWWMDTQTIWKSRWLRIVDNYVGRICLMFISHLRSSSRTAFSSWCIVMHITAWIFIHWKLSSLKLSRYYVCFLMYATVHSLFLTCRLTSKNSVFVDIVRKHFSMHNDNVH